MITRIGFAMLCVLGTLLTACGGTATAPSGSSQPVDVHIKLTDFKIESDLENFEKGETYRFLITNDGAVAHEFVILPIGAQHDMSNMPGMSGAETSDADELVHIAEGELPPGASKTVEVIFKNDTKDILLEIACHIPGHYEAGMNLGISVN